MKILLILAGILYASTPVFSQYSKPFLELYERDNKTNDTLHYCMISVSSKGYIFTFPERIRIYYEHDSNNTKIDTVKETLSMSYGPYIFVRKRGKIMFKDLTKSRKPRDLYNIKNQQFLAPELFSTSTDSYIIPTILVDSNYILSDKKDSLSCYRYLQEIRSKKGNIYRVIFIEKSSFLPYRIEYYNDKNLTVLISEIFSMKKSDK